MRGGRVALLSALLLSLPASSATITIVNVNDPGVGFNDTTPASPVGGNQGATLGEQRLNCFREAARIWGALLPSAIEIRIQAQFAPRTCSDTSAVLGSAGAISIHSGFNGAPRSSTWYVAALANALSGRDIDETRADISATFNVDLGKPGCLPSSGGFYLGLDGNHGTQIDLVTVLLHEFGHGLGFASTVGSSGTLTQGQDDAYMVNLVDGVTGKSWSTAESTIAERAASAVSGRLAWGGENVRRFASSFLRGTPALVATAPAAVAGTYAVGDATFGAALSADVVAGQLVLARDAADATGASDTDGCTAITNPAEVSGKIALLDRGSCTFVIKAKNAQNAGAIAVVIVDNVASATPAGMSGTDASITIPSVRVTLGDGTKLRAALPASISLGLDPTRLAGADTSGRMRMYSPDPYESGSSVSHFDTSSSPNALMEPSINGDLLHNLDATLPLLKDVGWFSASPASWILPSAARAPGVGGAFYTTDVTVGNDGAADASVTLKFLGNNQDGSSGPEKAAVVPRGGFVTFTDVLKSAFDVDGGYGAIRVTSTSSKLSVTSQTSTPGPSGGTFGQSVPAVPYEALGIQGGSRVIAGAREDASFRTNLVLVNATSQPLDLTITVLAEDGTTLGTQTPGTFQPLEMRQVGRVISTVSGRGDVVNATIRVSSQTPGGAFATYATVIDNTTNDPRTLLAAPDVTAPPVWILPSSARASGVGGAFYTTDLTVANRGPLPASLALQFLGNNRDGRVGPSVSLSLDPGRSRRLEDVLGGTFSLGQDYGALRLTASTVELAVVSQTSTPGGGGTFGQSVPALPGSASATPGYPLRIYGAREDASFRTNLVVVNTREVTTDVTVVAYDAAGQELGRTEVSGLRPLEMRQVGRILQVATSRSDIRAASLLVSTSTPGAAVATYATVIDNTTNDPRTLLAP